MADSDGTPLACKRCARCKAEKPASREFFSGLKKAKDGLHSWCKACCAEERRLDRAADPERYAAIEKVRHERHKEKRQLANRLKWAERKEVYLPKVRLRAELMRDVYNANRRKVRGANLELYRARQRKFRIDNSEKVKASERLRWLRATRQQRLRSSIGAAVWDSVKRGSKANRPWHVLLGFDTQQLMVHLQRQFLPGMTWQNYGSKWHIDHILPVASFKFETPEDEAFKHCWCLANLRPLWAKDNLIKRDKVLYLL